MILDHIVYSITYKYLYRNYSYYLFFFKNLMINNYLLTIINILINLIDVLAVILPMLLSVAFMTIIERKQLAAHQRRVGPTIVGYYGIAQPFADALKLILKETVIPSQSNKVLFYLAPVSTLIFSLLGWGIIPFGQGLTLFDFSLGIFYTLALSSLGVYGILFAGWSANSKYAFLGSLRSTAAMISYELILSSAILIIILLAGSFNYTAIIEVQQIIVNGSYINLQSIILGLKTCIFCFLFVLFRATLPRLRYDQLISLCWINLLPIAVAFIILVPSLLVAFDIAPY